MNIGTSLKKPKSFITFLGLIILLGILIGFLLYQKMDNTALLLEIKNIENYLATNHINYILFHFVTISLLITCSLTIIGLVIFPIYLLFESISISYSIFLFTENFHFSGFIYGLLYTLFTKLIFIIILIIIFKKILSLIKVLIKAFSNHEDRDFKYMVFKNLKAIILYLLFIFLNDILIYFISSKLLLKLTFILK